MKPLLEQKENHIKLLVVSVKKGYYMTFGVDSQNIEKIVNSIEKELNLTLERGDEKFDEELYILADNSDHDSRIVQLNILENEEGVFYLGERKLNNIRYLISCNIIDDLSNSDIYADNISHQLSSIDSVQMLIMDTDEWT